MATRDMSDPVIQLENIGKKYVISHKRVGRQATLRDHITDSAKTFRRRLVSPHKNPHAAASREEFWALRNLSLQIWQGEIVGLIGQNGAGKSTLLKLLSRITEPTTGRIVIRGSLASLLEVGAGFHSELTGRENVFLNGAILGMSKAEIQRKFGDIVAFSGVEKFLDTPVKRYSSGMYVRLAFSVAVHLEPDILIVDEVLAVGDAEFREKCLNKMGDVSRKEGGTVIFVSHNMDAIKALCSRAYLLEEGRIKAEGDPLRVIDEYLTTTVTVVGSQPISLADRTDRMG